MLFFIIGPANDLSGQKHAQPDDKEVALAQALQKKHEDAAIVALRSTEVYDFHFDKKSKLVGVDEQIKEQFICAQTHGKHGIVKFYDEQSSVESIEVLYKSGKKYAPSIRDDYYNSEDFFYTDARVKYFTLSFPQQGFQYQVNTHKQFHDIKYFTKVYFRSSYPIEEKEIRFVLPRWLHIELKEINFEGYDIKKTVEKNEAEQTDTYIYSIKNLGATKRENRAPGPSHVYPHLLILAKSYTQNGTEHKLFNSTDDLYAWYASLVKQVDNQPAQLQSLADEITAGAETDLDKIKAIYYWVQDNIRYIAFEDGIAGFKPASCQQVMTDKFGDCKGMANLTKELLKIAGFDARLCWIGTRRIAYDYSQPTLAADNHMICAVQYEGKKYFLDPTEKYNPFSEYAERIQGRQVMIENGDAYDIETIPVSEVEKNTERIVQEIDLSGETILGKAQHDYSGESRANLLYNIHRMEKSKLEDALHYYITEGNKNLAIDELETSSIEEREGVFQINYNFQLENAVSSFDDEMYIDFDYYKEFGNFKMKEERSNDYLFRYKLKLVRETHITLPDGYQVKSMPQGFQEEDEFFQIRTRFDKKDQKIIYTKEISIDKALLPKPAFQRWNETIDRLNEFYQEQIVLEKT